MVINIGDDCGEDLHYRDLYDLDSDTEVSMSDFVISSNEDIYRKK